MFTFFQKESVDTEEELRLFHRPMMVKVIGSYDGDARQLYSYMRKRWRPLHANLASML